MYSRPVYHQRQKRACCAIHTVKNLSQEDVFTQEDFNELANEVDEEELKIGIRTKYDPSNNYDSNDGDYSIEVIMRASKMTNIDLIRIDSESEHVLAAKQDHTSADSYVVNIHLTQTMNPWFAIRKFDEGWFNLDSRLNYPERLKVNGPKFEILSQTNFLAVYVVVERE